MDIGWIEPTTSVPDSRKSAGFLLGNAPNPFRGSTAIHFELGETEQVRLEVFDLAGRLVRKLVDAPLEARSHTITWDGNTDSGRNAAAGMYYLRLKSEDREESRRMLLMR
jgi:hypothetical protein